MPEVWEWRLNNMGKVRVNTLGDEALEQKQKEETEKRKEAKKAAKSQADSAEITGEPAAKPEKKKMQKKNAKKHVRSPRYVESAKMVDKAKAYSLKEALATMESLKKAKFDETVELHINTNTGGVTGSVVLPHGTGKQMKIAILAVAKDPKGAEALIKEIEGGKINFDILIATPDSMPKLAKVARILGPKGLMPNPKNGTVTPKPEEVAEKFKAGQLNYKTEAKAQVIHVSVGKVSFGATKLAENINTFLNTLDNSKVKSIYLKSTMSPSFKLAR